MRHPEKLKHVPLKKAKAKQTPSPIAQQTKWIQMANQTNKQQNQPTQATQPSYISHLLKNLPSVLFTAAVRLPRLGQLPALAGRSLGRSKAPLSGLRLCYSVVFYGLWGGFGCVFMVVSVLLWFNCGLMVLWWFCCGFNGGFVN